MIQVRNVPDAIHRRLKARAAMLGMSMSEYALGELRRALERPTRQELAERVSRRASVALAPAPADLVRRERERR